MRLSLDLLPAEYRRDTDEIPCLQIVYAIVPYVSRMRVVSDESHHLVCQGTKNMQNYNKFIKYAIKFRFLLTKVHKKISNMGKICFVP